MVYAYCMYVWDMAVRNGIGALVNNLVDFTVSLHSVGFHTFIILEAHFATLGTMEFILICILLSVGCTCTVGQRIKHWGDTSGKSAAEKHIFAAPVKATIQTRNITYQTVSSILWDYIKLRIQFMMFKSHFGHVSFVGRQRGVAWHLVVGEKCAE